MGTRSFLGIAILAGVLATTGCASSKGPANVNQSGADKITSIEITQTPAQSAYDLVFRLRPHWLRAGATGSIGGGSIRNQLTLVYLDGQKLGTLDALRSVTAAGIQRLEWINASRAAIVLSDVGSDPIAGAIAIYTR